MVLHLAFTRLPAERKASDHDFFTSWRHGNRTLAATAPDLTPDSNDLAVEMGASSAKNIAIPSKNPSNLSNYRRTENPELGLVIASCNFLDEP